MAKQKTGVIVNIASMSHKRGGPGSSVHYAASKGAVVTMSMGVAREFADQGIRCISISPGPVDTAFQETAATSEELKQRFKDDIPMKRNRRSGGRSARKLKRAAPLPDNIKPIGPGMIGGTYKPLSKSDISAIEQTIFQLLNEVGLSQAPDTGIASMLNYGAFLGDDQRLKFPENVVRKAIGDTHKNITLFGQVEKFDMH